VYLCYLDESGDPGPASAVPAYTVAGVLVHTTQWVDLFERQIAFRRYLRREFGLYMRTEVKGAQLAKGSGPWVGLGLGDRARKRIYRSYMRFQGKSGAIKTYAIVTDKSACPDAETVRERTWRYALQRVETFARKNNDTVMVLPDSGQYAWLQKLARRMRRHSVVGSLGGEGSLRRDLLKVLIDDPVERDSKQSYFIQLADLNAYAAYRSRFPASAFPTGMWSELRDAILVEANKWSMGPGGEPGIVEVGCNPSA
jgi:hypothetical protein